MAFLDKLDALAKNRAETRQAEIERLLSEHAGRLQRASQMAGEQAGSGANARDHEQWLARATPRPGPGGRALVFESAVPLTADAAAHPRGYVFSPAPAAPDEAVSREELRLLGVDPVPDAPVALDRIAFVDTETTGLAGSAGTYVFLVGVGWFRRASGGGLEFAVEQIFMEDYCHESAVLAHLRDRLADFDALATYNGRGFDMPLLEARFVMNRLRAAGLVLPHLDLLAPSRRLFRGRLDSCSLSSIERNVLGMSRTHDIPGGQIPGIYFDYARGAGRARMPVVFDHHAQDIISLGALLLLFLEWLRDPAHPGLREPSDAMSMGRLLHRRGSPERSLAYLERAVHESRDAALTESALTQLAAVYRRLGRDRDAAGVWESAWRRHGLARPEACIELAKAYEHRLHDYEAALALIADAERQAALHRQLGTRTGADAGALLADLAARRRRIERKSRKRA